MNSYRRSVVLAIACLSVAAEASGAEQLGYVEQKFTHLHFEPGRWTRTSQGSCYLYVAKDDGSTVEVLRYGMNNLVPFRAKKGLGITVCGSVAAFDEGFEVEMPGMRGTSSPRGEGR